MVGPTDVVQPPVSRAACARDAWLCHVSSVGGARRCGCAAAGAPEFFRGLLAPDLRPDVQQLREDRQIRAGPRGAPAGRAARAALVADDPLDGLHVAETPEREGLLDVDQLL